MKNFEVHVQNTENPPAMAFRTNASTNDAKTTILEEESVVAVGSYVFISAAKLDFNTGLLL